MSVVVLTFECYDLYWVWTSVNILTQTKDARQIDTPSDAAGHGLIFFGWGCASSTFLFSCDTDASCFSGWISLVPE